MRVLLIPPPAAMHSALYLRVESGAYAPHADDCAIRPYPTGRAPPGGVKTLGTMGNCGNPTDGGRGHTLSAPASPLRINVSIRFLFPAAALCDRQPPGGAPYDCQSHRASFSDLKWRSSHW